MNKMIKLCTISLTAALIFTASIEHVPAMDVEVAKITATMLPAYISPSVKTVVTRIPEKTVEKKPLVSDDDIELIALVTMAEAEGESEKGQRLVIDTILNRVDSEHFPNTIYDVIYQPNQFTPIWNGRLARCEVRENICQLVREELVSRTNCEMVFFTAGRYSNYGVPIFQVGSHYFSSYK